MLGKEGGGVEERGRGSGEKVREKVGGQRMEKRKREERWRRGGEKKTRRDGEGEGRGSERSKRMRETSQEDALGMHFLSKMYFKGSCFRVCDLQYQGEATSQTMTSTFFKPSK